MEKFFYNWMEIKLSKFSFIFASAILAPTAVLAQVATPTPIATGLKVGAIIYDPQGAEVGKIDSIVNDVVIIDTGTHKAALAKASFGSGAKGPTVSLTKAQLDAQVAAAMEKAATALNAALVPGAPVHGKAGALIGTVKEVTGDQVVIDRASGPVSLTKQAFATDPRGVIISLTAQELDAAAKAAAAPKP